MQLLISAAGFHTEANLRFLEEADAAKDELVEASARERDNGTEQRTERPGVG